MDVHLSTKGSYQANCFTPKRTLARTPPKTRREAENISPGVTKPLLTRTTTGSKAKKQQQLSPGEDNGKKKAQNGRLTAKPVLKERNSPTDRDAGTEKESVIDDLPPPSRWEIPRTPVRVVEHIQLKPSFVVVPGNGSGGGGGAAGKQRTPVRIKTPVHPLAHSNKATSPAVRASETGTPVNSGRDRENCSENVQFSRSEEDKPSQMGDGELSVLGKVAAKDSSPPISVSKGIGTLPGLNCNDNDLAFLQRMQNIKKYEELKAEAEQLGKAHKTAAEKKEQFEHEVLKVERDLHDMKLSYKEAALSVQTLITNPRDTKHGVALSTSDAKCTSSEHQAKSIKQHELTQTNLSQLRKLNQLSSARVEKTEKEVKGKLVEVEKAKWQLQSKIRDEEERKLGEKAQLQLALEATKQEHKKWKQKVDQEEENYTSLKNKLKEAQSELATLQEQHEEEEEEEETDSSVSNNKERSFCAAEEKRRAEERLKRLIRRCELYIRRHQMLREMGTKI